MRIPDNTPAAATTASTTPAREAAPPRNAEEAAPTIAGDRAELGDISKCPFFHPPAQTQTTIPEAGAAAVTATAPATAPPAPPIAPARIAAIEETKTFSGATPTTTWHDPPPDTPAEQQGFRDDITRLQTRLKEAGLVEHLDRGFHQKQTWGGKATVEFSPNMPKELQNEAFAKVAGRSFHSVVRFSNGQGCPAMDAKPDVRGLAFKMNIDGQEVDLLATNHITFARDAKQFLKTAEILDTMATSGTFSAAHELYDKIKDGEYNGHEAARIAARIVADTAPPTHHLAGISYWTQAVKVGPWVGRFVIEPENGADTQPGVIGRLKDKNYLHDSLETDLQNHDVSMRIRFEAFTNEEVATDASIHGDHVTYDVGRLILNQRAKDTADRTLEEATVSKAAFNPMHGLRLAGTINETNRGVIYDQSAHNRGAVGFTDPDLQKLLN